MCVKDRKRHTERESDRIRHRDIRQSLTISIKNQAMISINIRR